MNKKTVVKFQKMFEDQRNNILYNDKIIREDFGVCADDKYDEVDQASADIEQSMRIRLRNRESLYLKKVEEALRRIESGTFGECEQCEEPIELKRLEARPTATLCIACKEDAERKEANSAFGQMHKSLGESFSRKYT